MDMSTSEHRGWRFAVCGKEDVELARGIEPPTCGLQSSESSPSDNLTPQETTTHDTGTVDADGAGLSCPGSSVVAQSDETGQIACTAFVGPKSVKSHISEPKERENSLKKEA